MTRSSARQGNPDRVGANRGETQAGGPTDPQGGRRAIPDRAVFEMHLGTVRPECDRPESPDDDAEVRIGRGLKYPKDKGYAKFLTTLGYDRNWAGMLAAKIVEEGRVRAATSQKKREFARALRRLAYPRLKREAFLADEDFCLFASSSSASPEICPVALRSAGLRRPFGAASRFCAVRSSLMLPPRMSIFSNLNRPSDPPPSPGHRKTKISPTD